MKPRRQRKLNPWEYRYIHNNLKLINLIYLFQFNLTQMGKVELEEVYKTIPSKFYLSMQELVLASNSKKA